MVGQIKKGRRTFFKFHNKVKLVGSEAGRDLKKLYKIVLVVLEFGKITAAELESARVSMKRVLKKKGKVIVRAYPFLPINERATGVRMGKGKAGKIKAWVYPVKPGKILYEISEVSLRKGRRVLELASKKLSVKTKISTIFLF